MKRMAHNTKFSSVGAGSAASKPLFGSNFGMELELESRIDAFEAAKVKDRSTSVRSFLPESCDAGYAPLLMELLRVDLEYSWEDGQREILQAYSQEFPEFFADRSRLNALAFEEYRLRRQAGDAVDPCEYRDRWGLDVDQWPALPQVGSTVCDLGGLQGTEYVLISKAAETETSSRSTPPRYPEAGEEFEGFTILEELGRGAVSRVFLARQQDLAGRPMVLKISTELWRESDRIARLQHTNIVPIYSVHRAGGMQAICMPYFGHTTLSHFLRAKHSSSQQATTLADVPEPFRTQESHETQCLRIVLRLAEALAHAHDRGIWHHDIKPANILLSDHGEPMLLDFNLSSHSSNEPVLVGGGTVPYMAPEQIRALHVPTPLGAGCDIFGLGVVLYQLLTGKLPYGADNRWDKLSLKHALDARAEVPSLTGSDHSISASTAAIVGRCLAPVPDARYRTAEELSTDLRRQLNHQPLLHAPNHSWKERFAKWCRRHPRLSSGTSIAIVACGLIAVAGISAAWNKHQLRQMQATTQLNAIASTVADLGPAMVVRDDGAFPEAFRETESLFQSLEQGSGPFGSFAELRDSLPQKQQLQLDQLRSQLFYYMADGTARNSLLNEALSESDRRAALQRAIELNQTAMKHATNDSLKSPLASQHQRLNALLTESSTNEVGDATWRELGGEGDAERLRILEHMVLGNFTAAAHEIERALQSSPRDANLWLLLGNCHRGLLDLREAELDFTAAMALMPETFRPYFHRGLVRLEAGDAAGAEEDFDRVIAMRSDLTEAYVNRAIARRQQDRYSEALEDLRVAFERGNAPARIHFLQQSIHAAMGDREAATRDFELGLKTLPSDELSWIARGVAKIQRDPQGAIADLGRALAINPASTRALQNMANVYGEKLNDLPAAIQTLDQMIRILPDHVTAIAGRGVLRARVGARDLAIADAKRADQLDRKPLTLYQLACLYALTSLQVPDDAAIAIHYLALAGKGDAQWFRAAKTDPDLKNLQDHPEFQRLLEAAGVLQAATAPFAGHPDRSSLQSAATERVE
jgi:serine/threonine protein kinase/lipoprotein NlpI